MLKLTNPRLRGSNVMLNSFGGCIPDAAEEFSWTPEVSFSEIPSEPRMFSKKLKGKIAFEQLQSFANTHRRGKFNKQMDGVNSDVELINFTPLSVSNLPKKKLTIHSKSVELERIFSIFNFPYKMESILSKAMFSKFQIHFLSPKSATRKKAHANFDIYFEEPSIQALPNTQTKKINLVEHCDSSPNLKVWVSSQLM